MAGILQGCKEAKLEQVSSKILSEVSKSAFAACTKVEYIKYMVQCPSIQIQNIFTDGRVLPCGKHFSSASIDDANAD